MHERLRRLLFLVPYVSRHPGITVDALARELSISREELLEELDLLTMVGRPPFQPDDYIDIYVENERVYVDLDQRLSAPPRLTASEAAALAAAAELLRPAAGGALESALHKLEKVIPPQARARFKEMQQKIDAGVVAPYELQPLVGAIAQRREVEFDYFSSNRGVSEPRSVRPLELFSHRGQWYLSAFDNARGDERLFRVDRLQNLTVTDRTFPPAQARSARVPNPAAHGDVRVRFSKVVAPYVRERFGDDARPAPDGAVDVLVSGESERWLAQWVLSFGGEAWVLEPESARRSVERAAQASLESKA
ncbi:MAG: WYL domain-containing protein [Myxococcaceae bacterium]|nr:WYL domain-containing protein [Myxococcaceae bacterium]